MNKQWLLLCFALLSAHCFGNERAGDLTKFVGSLRASGLPLNYLVITKKPSSITCENFESGKQSKRQPVWSYTFDTQSKKTRPVINYQGAKDDAASDKWKRLLLVCEVLESFESKFDQITYDGNFTNGFQGGFSVSVALISQSEGRSLRCNFDKNEKFLNAKLGHKVRIGG